MLKEIIEKSFIKKSVVLAFCFAVGVILSLGFTQSFASAKDASYESQLGNKIALVDMYQKKYFEIIKRHNILLQCDDIQASEKDRQELEDLFTEVEEQITNKKYLKKYRKIQEKYAETDSDTTIDINEFAENNYNAVDDLLNSVYKKSKSKMSGRYLKKFVSSQKKWEQEVSDYKQVFDAMGFGTIGSSTYYSYMVNMEEFRALLLMLYL